MAAVCYYISGHGFGHARRSVEVARQLGELRPDLDIHLRSAAHESVFAGLRGRIHHEHVEVDRGVIESSALSLDWRQTIESVRSLVEAMPARAASEAAFLRRTGVKLIIADVPWLAGYIAVEAGIPCYAACNFLWDWIYAPHLAGEADGERLLEILAGGYQRMAGWLRLPFPHESTHFREIVDVPFIAVAGSGDRAKTLAGLDIAKEDRRPRVLVAMRGGAAEAASHAANADHSLIYLMRGAATGAAANLHCIPPNVPFSDLMEISDVVVSKLGHGIVTDCVASDTRLLWPLRNGFAEDPLLSAGLTKYVPHRSLALADYQAGHWAKAIHELLQAPHPQRPARTDGAAFLAKWISGQLAKQL